MAQENFLLSQKVKLIYDILCRGDKERCAELLSDVQKVTKNPNYLRNRSKTIDRIMRDKTASVQRMKAEFDNLPIAKLQMEDGTPLFTKKLFFSSTLDEFRKRLERYQQQERVHELGLDLAYRYLYLFDHRDTEAKVVIERYDIEYLPSAASAQEGGVAVRFYPQVSGESYKGSVQSRASRVIYALQNSRDSMLILFNTALESGSREPLFDKALYGVAVGIDDTNLQIVVAKKVALMQRKLSDDELEKLYLVLNETQKIEARENRYALDDDISLSDSRYLAKYNPQIIDMNRFFSTLKYSDTIRTTLGDHMVFAEFYAFSMLYDKYASKQNFFLTDRKRIMLEMLRYIEMYPPSKVTMVLPLYAPHENIFLYSAVERESVYELLLQRAKAGTSFEIVFVIERPQDYKNVYMEGVFAQLQEAGVWFGFVDRVEIAGEVTYSDFIFSDIRDVAIIKDHPARKEVFTITKEKAYIEGCVRDFLRLKEQAVGYEDVLDEQCILGVHDGVLRQLMGRWYGYFYGSVVEQDGKPKLWEISFDVGNDYSIVEKRDNRMTATGEVKISAKQSLFQMQHIRSKNSYYFVFDHEKIDEAFFVMAVSTHFSMGEQFASMGIFSRKRLDEEQAKTLLGDPKKSVMLPPSDMHARLQEYLYQLRTDLSIQSR
jgi:hypothetical protein